MKVPSKSHPLFILEAKKSRDRTTRGWCVAHSSTWWASLKCGIAWGWFLLRGWQLRPLHAMNCHLYFVYAQQLDNKSFCRAFIQLSSFIHCSTSIRRERRHIFKFFGLVSPMPTTTLILIVSPICLFSFETSGEQTRFIWSFERSTLGEGFLFLVWLWVLISTVEDFCDSNVQSSPLYEISNDCGTPPR